MIKELYKIWLDPNPIPKENVEGKTEEMQRFFFFFFIIKKKGDHN